MPRGAVRLGAVGPASKLHLDITLKVRDQAALTAFLAGLSNRQSPMFHRFLRPGQFGPRFGPTLTAIAAVRAALRQAGLSPGAVSGNRLAIPVTASAAAVEHAFGISLIRYRMPGGWPTPTRPRRGSPARLTWWAFAIVYGPTSGCRPTARADSRARRWPRERQAGMVWHGMAWCGMV